MSFHGLGRSGRSDENVLLLAERQLDHAVSCDVTGADQLTIVADHGIVEAHGTIFEKLPHLAVRFGQTGAHEQRENTDAGLELCRGHVDGRQVCGKCAFFKGLAGGFGRFLGCGAAMQGSP